MNKKKKRGKKLSGLLLLFMLSALSGCGTVSDTLEDFAYTVGSFTEDAIDDLAARLRYRDEDDRYVINVVEEELPQTVITINDEDFVSAGNSAKLSGNALRGLRLNELSSIVDNYAYAMISDEERLIYDEVYDLLVNFKEDMILSTVDTDLIDHAFTCVLIDHPEIYYIKGYTIKTYTRDGVIEKITMNGTYTMTQTQVLEMLSELESYYQACLSSIPEGSDDYEKVKAVYEYIIRSTEYDLHAPNNQNVLSVFVGHRSVCQGYAKATQYILNRLGIFCTLVEGTVKGTEAHVWNVVRLNGEYYHVDTTWGDASYKLVSDYDKEVVDLKQPEINYDYLCVTTDAILKTHSIKEIVPLMDCSSIESNYYVREGLYFTYIDDDGLKRAFDNAYANMDLTITLKCSDETVYAEMTDYLLENQKIFRYLVNTSVSYVTVDDQNELIFYL
ncbi:MAG: hypothetical protein IJ873_09110 [Lachnospiraceae bacterium]|nr:hypothetical protein [Lachnospiraceae bacterium]